MSEFIESRKAIRRSIWLKKKKNSRLLTYRCHDLKLLLVVVPDLEGHIISLLVIGLFVSQQSRKIVPELLDILQDP